MQAFRSFTSILLFVLLSIPPYGKQPGGQPEYIRLYRFAEKLYNKAEPTSIDDSLALAAYTRVASMLSKKRLNDSILWDACFKAAIYHQTNGDYNKAISYFRQALQLKTGNLKVQASSFYLPNLYMGNSWYFLGRYDSARYYYKEAETIALANPGLGNLERLYNTMGVMNFESGNYLQSRNYFEKAVRVLEQSKQPNFQLLVNFKSNLATSLRKLSAYDEAMQIYKNLLNFETNQDELFHNIASIYLSTGENDLALEYLHRVRTDGLNKYNDLGLAHFQNQNDDSAFYYFTKADNAHAIENRNRKNLYHGLTLRYLGDYYQKKGQYDESLKNYQKALQQLVYSFDDSSVYINPKEYYGAFSFTELFETLSSKGSTLAKKYSRSKNRKDLDASLNSFVSLYQLIDYAEKTYDTDDARIFLNKKKHRTHDQPLRISLQLYSLTGDNNYLEQAFYFDERNKASSLTAELYEKEIKKKTGIPDSLLANENSIKENINRLSLRSSTIRDSVAQKQAMDELLELEIKLSALEKKFNEFPDYERMKFSYAPITLDKLRKDIIPQRSAILSFHLGEEDILQWIITPNTIDHRIIPISDSFFKSIEVIARTMEPGNNDGQAFKKPAREFYQLLIKPIEHILSDYPNLMIIPDDELNNIPFEILLNDKEEYLVSHYAISYNSSCTLLGARNNNNRQAQPYSLLALAPFSTVNRGQEEFGQLPASEEEVKGLKGKILLGEQATKLAFTNEASQFRILHLATHARADEDDPRKSYIAFYLPQKDSASLSGKLFTSEIYDLQLSNTWLAVLTACQTGGGQLIKGEGTMSLARAFAFAGCPNIITTQWKADDEATAFISKRLHYYLENGNTIANSLRKAKLDYLKDNSISERFKIPAYWAQLRLIGQFEKKDGGRNWYWWIALALIPILFLGIKKVLQSRTTKGV